MSGQQTYEYIKAFSIGEALDALSKHGSDAMLFAGGTDLLVQIKQHVVRPLYLIDLEGISRLRGITEENAFLSIGALATLRETEKSATVRSVFPALAKSAHDVGAVQLRNTATIGGNLCQSIKCPYYNQSHINLFMRESIKPCIRRGGKICYTAKWGSEIGHAIIAGTNRCKASFGSNIAVALAALEGCVAIVGESGSREVNIENLYGENGELNIASDEIITHIKIPASNQSTNVFLQYKPNPASYTLLNIGASLALEDDRETCKSVRVWLGGVAPGPYEAREVEEYLKGKRLSSQIIEEASRLLFEGVGVAEPTMSFKVAKARALCREALIKVLEGS